MEKIPVMIFTISRIMPYLLRYREFHTRLLHIPEDSANGLITGEPFGQGKQIVSQGRDRGCGKLCSEVPGLAFAHTQQPLGSLEEDLECLFHPKSIPF